MNRRLITASAVASLTMGLIGALTIPAIAGNQRPDPAVDAAVAAGVSPQVFQALARDLKLDTAGVQARLANESKASKAELKLRKSLGDGYAGSWLNPDASVLHVAVTNAAQVAQVQAAGATPQLVTRTLDQLDGVKAQLDARAANAPKRVPGWYVDVRTNSVVVLYRAGGLDAATAWAGDSVRYEASVEDPKPFIDVIGGNAYYIGSGTRCSIGFSVNGGFVTAGHCGTTGATTTQPSGSFAGSSFPGNDYAWVRVGAGNVMRPWVKSGTTNVTVQGSTDAAVGASVCRSGSTTGWHCGTIQARNSSVTYPQGTVTGLIRTNVCAEPGDSGGSLIAGSQAQGVTSGGSGNCSSGGTTYFQPVNEILQTYTLTLVTGGTTPPPTTTPPSSPPPGGCSGHEFNVNGNLASGGNGYQPNNSYYYSASPGAHRACLAGPGGSDYDLYLQKWNGTSWAAVATSNGPTSNESVNYSGTAGYYRYRIHAYSGSGAYALGYTNP